MARPRFRSANVIALLLIALGTVLAFSAIVSSSVRLFQLEQTPGLSSEEIDQLAGFVSSERITLGVGTALVAIGLVIFLISLIRRAKAAAPPS